MEKVYICIDLKSFYASVECVERKLNPLTTNLVVADFTRTEKTICLAVTPSLKKYGLSGRSRLYEVNQVIRDENRKRKGRKSSYQEPLLKLHPDWKIDFLIAPPRMKLYMKYSANIYQIYLSYFSKEDIYVYSIDEVFCDVTNYLKLYECTPKELVKKIVLDIYHQTGITATAGIGTNLFLAKVAMDVLAKKEEPIDGVRIAELDEISYRKKLWDHKPLTDFWRIGKGISKKLETYQIHTMGDLARASLTKENFLYKLFGVNAEMMIDHAWGYEPTTMEEIKSYRPKTNCLSSSQVLKEPYSYEKAKIIVKEMAELLSLDLACKHLLTNQLVLTIGYDIENLKKNYEGEVTTDFYGRKIPKHGHGTIHLDFFTSSTTQIMKKVMMLLERITNQNLTIRRIHITACNLKQEKNVSTQCYQLNLFEEVPLTDQKELEMQRTIIKLKQRFGKNSILKGMNYMEGATTIERNEQVGGHRG